MARKILPMKTVEWQKQKKKQKEDIEKVRKLIVSKKELTEEIKIRNNQQYSSSTIN